jgi:hypothetical protein
MAEGVEWLMWRLSWGEAEWTADDLTGAHAALICLGIGSDTWDLSPAVGPIHLIAVLAAFVSLAEDRPYAVVADELRAARLSALTDALTF